MTKTRRHRVRFAPGPLADQYATIDGHPQHEGLTAIQRRSVPSPWPVDLTAHNIRMLEAEVGDICQPSIQRLKRRVGLLPAVQRQLEYLTARKAPSPSASLPQLQPIISRTRSLKQPNPQPTHSAVPDFTPHVLARPRSASRSSRQHTNDINTVTKQQQETGAGRNQGCELTLHPAQVQQQQQQQHSRSDSRRSSDAQLCMLGPAIADSDSHTRLRTLHGPPRQSSGSRSPKRTLSNESTLRRQANRSKSVRTD